MMFRILLGIDIVAAAIVGYFFIVGLADGSVSSFNGGLWFAVLAGIAAILGGGIALRRAAHPALANLVLTILAFPATGFGLFMLVAITSGVRWN
jgi:hypothetical protein